LIITLSENCVYPDIATIDTLNTTKLIASKIKEVDVEIVDSSLFVPIGFQVASAKVNSSDLTILDKIAKIMNSNTSLKLRLIAHTDCRGEEKYNLTLSENRAKYVYDYLVSKGILNSRLSYSGVGESKPFINCQCDICSDEELAKNRRVEFIIQQ